MKKGYLLILLGVALFAGAVFAQVDNSGARPMGAGGAFVAVADDANAALWNPAGMEDFRNMALTLSYSRLYLGVQDDGLNDGYLGFVNHLGRYGRYGSFGLSYSQFFAGVYREGIFTLGYAKRLFGAQNGANLSLGLNGKMVWVQANTGGFSDDFEADDPVVSTTSKFVPSADVGLMLNAAKWLSFGVCAADLLQPDISLSSSGGDPENIRPMTVRGGVALRIKGFRPSFEVEYGTRQVNGAADMKLHGGFEQSLGRSLTLRGGYSRAEAGVGFGYKHIGEKTNWGLDYAVQYPLNKLGAKFFTTHRVAFNLEIAPPPVPLEDLELSDGKIEIFPKQLVAGNSITVRAKVINRSEIPEKNVRISMYYQDENGSWNLCVPPLKVNFDIGEEKDATMSWTPPGHGHYTIYVSVDDDGKKLPRLHSRVEEIDEENNTGVGECDVYMTPEGIIAPRDNRLAVSKLTLYQEEEPIIPVIYFDGNSSQIDPRFNRMLGIIADRLKTNPDVKIFLKGYYSKESDKTDDNDGLAQRRAQAVKGTLTRLGAPQNQIEIVSSGYDMSQSRAGTPEDQLNKKSRKLQLEENRRCELDAWFVSGKEFLAEVPYQNALAQNGIDMVSSVMGKISALLESDPEVIVLCESYVPPNDDADADKVFQKAGKVADYIKRQLDPKYSERVYIHQGYKEDADPNKIYVFPVSEGVIFRPKVGDRVLTDYNVEGNDENLVKIDAEVEAGIDSFSVTVIDGKGNLIRTLAAGKGQVPEGLSWDWRDNAGELLDFDDLYFAKLELWDKLGQRLTVTSDTMAIEVTKSAKRIETLVIVEFVFNEIEPESKFLESRVQYVAERFIKRAQAGYTSITAVVTGHTDSIGAEYANNALSQRRAERELKNIRRYMIYLLGLSSQTELDNWLTEHNVTLKAKGYGETKPYSIVRWNNAGEREKVLLGDNSEPEGRTVNRRVLLELKSERTPQSSAMK